MHQLAADEATTVAASNTTPLLNMSDHRNDYQHVAAASTQIDPSNELFHAATQIAVASRTWEQRIVRSALPDEETDENGVPETLHLMRRIRRLEEEVQQLEMSCENLADRRQTVGKETALKVLKNQELLRSILQATDLNDAVDSDVVSVLQQQLQQYCA